MESLNNETSPEADAIREALSDRIGRHVTTRSSELLSADNNKKVGQSPRNKPISCDTDVPKNSNNANFCERNDQYDRSFSNGRPVAGSEGEAKWTEGQNKLLAPHNLNVSSAIRVSHKDPATQHDGSSMAEPISGECEGPPKFNADEKASKSPDVTALPVCKNPTRPVSKSPTRPVSKSPTRLICKSPTRPVCKRPVRGSLSPSQRRALALLRSSGRRGLPCVGGISCSMGSGNGGGRNGHTSGRGSGGSEGGGVGRGGRGGGGIEGGGGSMSGSDGVDGRGDGSGRGRGGWGAGGSGDSKRDKKGGTKKERSANKVTWTLDSGLGAEKSTSGANNGTDVANPLQETVKLKLENASLLVPSQAERQGLEALTLPIQAPFAAGIPSSALPSTVSSGTTLDTPPGVFLRPKKVAESCELAIQESQDCEGGLHYLDPAYFSAAPDFGLEPPFKPFSAAYAWEINFEDTDSPLPYATPVLESQPQPVGAVGTVNDVSSDSLETRTDMSEGSISPRRPQPFFSACEVCGDLPQSPFERKVCTCQLGSKKPVQGIS